MAARTERWSPLGFGLRLSRDFLQIDKKALAKLSNFFSVNKYTKTALMLFVAMSHLRIFSSKSSFLRPGQAFELNFSHWSKQTWRRPGQGIFWTHFQFFSMSKFAKTALNLFVGLPNNKLPTNFQLNIVHFEARVSLQTLLQSLKQKRRKSARIGNVLVI